MDIRRPTSDSNTPMKILVILFLLTPLGIHAQEVTVTSNNAEAIATELVSLRDRCQAKDEAACIDLVQKCHIVDDQHNDDMLRRWGYAFSSYTGWIHLRSTLTKCEHHRFDKRIP